MKQFRSNVGDIISNHIKNIYNKNIGKARQRDGALKRVANGATRTAPAN